MTLTPALSAAYPPVAGEAAPSAQADGVRVLGLVQRMMDTGMAMARCINRIARQRLEGQPLSRLAPPGFNPTATNALVVQAVAWLAALRERLMATVRPSLVAATGRLRGERAPQGRGAAFYLPDEPPERTEDDWHDWKDLAKPLRIGPAGVAVAAQQIAALSSAEVVSGVNGFLGRALTQLGADADVPLLTAVAEQARAMLPEPPAVPEAVEVPAVSEAPAVVETSAAVSEEVVPPVLVVPPARPRLAPPAREVDRDPPPKPPD